MNSVEDSHLGNYSMIQHHYLLDDYMNESKKYQVEAFVYIQCGWERTDAVSEVKWAQALISQSHKNHGIVGYLDLLSENFHEVLEAALSARNFRGIRQILNYDIKPYYRGCSIDYLNDLKWHKNFAILNQYELCFDLQIYPEQVDAACELVMAYPGVRFIINHALMPKERSHEYYVFWKKKLVKLSEYRNVFIKLSGFGMFEPNWSTLSVQPFIETAIEIFGPKRAMFASNFPVDKLYKTFDEVYDIYFAIIKKYSPSEQEALLKGNARWVYRLIADANPMKIM